jgi:hypothetical protein
MASSLQATRQVLEGSSHPDRDAQFEPIAQQVKAFQAAGQPVISVDPTTHALGGAFSNNGRARRPKGDPEKVRVHDFERQALGKVAPDGVYDQTHQTGWGPVGTDHDTAAGAVERLRRWWNMMGRQLYPHAQRWLTTADGGGSHGARTRLWKIEWQKLVSATGLEMAVSHVPPGTSQWHKIDHRLFSSISQNWRGKPWVSPEVIVNLIASTTTRTGLTVRGARDTNTYPTGIKVPDEEFTHLNLVRDEVPGEWNYPIQPTPAAM